jgi:hypothetical protein
MVQHLHVSGGGSSGGSGVSYANTVFVTKDGNDGTGVRERLDLPFLTIVAGLAAAQSGDQVWIGPGVFAEAAIVVPNTLSPLTIRGSGKDTTFITRATGTGIVVSGDVAAQVLTLADFSITMAGGASTALMINGFPADIPFVGLRLENLRVTGSEAESIQMNGCSAFYAEGTTCSHSVAINFSTGIWRDSDFAADVIITRTLPSTLDPGLGTVLFDSCELATNLILQDAAQVHTLASTYIRGNITANLTTDGANGPHVYLENSLGDPLNAGSGDITMDLPALGATDTLVKIRCTGLGGGAVWSFTRAGAGVSNVDADYSRPLQSTITVSGNVAVSMRNVPTEALTLTAVVGAATLDRDIRVYTTAGFAIGSNVFNIDPPFPNALYTVTMASNGVGSDLITGAKTASTVEIIAAAVSTVGEIALTRNS